MEEAVAKIICAAIEAAPKVVAVLVEKNGLNQIDAKLKTVLAKQDQQVLSAMRSGLVALCDGLQATAEETRRQRLAYAENALLPLTQLTPSLTTGGESNLHWIALANYGLAVLAETRGDHPTAALHLLRVFEADPRLAREKLACDLYRTVFHPRCGPVLDWKAKQVAEIVDNQQYVPRRDPASAIGAVAVGVGGAFAAWLAFSVYPPLGIGVAQVTRNQCKKMWDESERPGELRQRGQPRNALTMLEREVAARLDERCREIAHALLEGKTLSGPPKNSPVPPAK